MKCVQKRSTSGFERNIGGRVGKERLTAVHKIQTKIDERVSASDWAVSVVRAALLVWLLTK